MAWMGVSSGDDRFAKLLVNPSFCIWLEVSGDAADAGCRERLGKAVAEDSRIFGMLVDMPREEQGLPLQRVCEEMSILTARPVMPVLSGVVSAAALREKIDSLRNAGFRDFLAVSGNLPRREHFACTDSVSILEMLRRADADAVIGGAVNPFKYNEEDLTAQYTKAFCKLRYGARFLVAQSGWDMKKYQELIWFLRSQEKLTPLLARISVLQRSDAERLSSVQSGGKSPEVGCQDPPDTPVDAPPAGWLHPGVKIPLLIAANLEREFSRDDFMKCQCRRAAFLAHGCRLLGYNGIVLSGIKTPEDLEMFLAALEKMAADYGTYDAWVVAANGDQWQGTAMIPLEACLEKQPPFYMYKVLLKEGVRDFEPYASRPVTPHIRRPRWRDVLAACASRKNTPPWVRRLLGWIVAIPTGDFLPSFCQGLDNRACPKRLCYGPCGGARPNGECECGGQRCFFIRVLRLAAYRGTLPELEGKPFDGEGETGEQDDAEGMR